MKKLIAILVVFAMVATVAFAETSVGGSVETRWIIAQQTNPDADVTTIGWGHAISLSLSTANDEGTFGGTLKMTYADDAGGGTGQSGILMAGNNVRAERAFVWWQPIPQIRFFLGEDGDGLMNSANIIRWAHHRMPRGISREDWDQSNFLLGNYDNFGAVVSIMPIDWITLHVALALGGREGEGSYGPMVFYDDSAAEAGLLQRRLQVQAVIAPEGIGTFYLTYRQRYVSGWPVDGSDRIGITYLSASFIDGLQFEVGGNYALLENYVNPLRIGIGATYSIEDFGVKFRAVMQPIEKPAVGDTPHGGLMLRMDIMPFYQFDFGSVYLNFRINTNSNNKVGWHINPYLKLNVGVGDFRVGLMVEDENGDGDASWRFPISMLVSF